MAFRKSSYRPTRRSSGRKFHVADALPLWTPDHSETANLVFLAALERFGITDLKSYWHKLRMVIVISVIVCMLIGASNYGLKGVILGGLLGLAAPAVLIWLGVMLTMIVIYMAVWCAVWAVIWVVFWWLLHS